jgi:hypothetical protein
MTNEFEFVKGQRGNDLLIYENYVYNKDYNHDGSVRWRCSNRSCRGAVYLDHENSITKQTEHSHPPVPEKISKLKIMANIKEKAATTTESAFNIIVE